MRRIIDFFIIPLFMILILVVAVIWVQKSSFTHKTAHDYIQDLSSSDVQKRWFAAYSLGKLTDPESVGPLLNALKDDSKEVKWHAAIALGNIKDKRSVPHLIKLLSDPNDGVKICAAQSLGLLEDPQASSALTLLLHHPNPVLRSTAAWALERLGVIYGFHQSHNELILQTYHQFLECFLEFYK
ncbi:MAG: HEAT repeat domain-containing protein [Chlamydiae bacterium]|nr:HEAT repeat domain-containing protein [Chlamydiota bacterium]MBI3277510.1 HEAT repeat domain-containing protein [Chlamydiota bacterium]